MGFFSDLQKGSAQDVTNFKNWMKKAKQGDAEKQCKAGWAYMTGKGVGKDLQQAQYWLRLAMSQGSEQAAVYLAMIYLNEDSFREYCFLGMSLIKRLTLSDNSEIRSMADNLSRVWQDAAAGQEIADIFSQTDGNISYQAIEVLDRFWVSMPGEIRTCAIDALCGTGESQASLGISFCNGMMGRSESPSFYISQGRYWLKLAADKGVKIAQVFFYGFFTGNDELDFDKGCAEAGNVEAQLAMGLRCETGKDVEYDLNKALDWYEKAAASGNEEAMNRYAGLALFEIPPDIAKRQQAIGYLEQLNRKGNIRACVLLANGLTSDTMRQQA